MTLSDSDLESHLQCCVCHEVLIEPVELRCSHMFCKLCIVRWLRRQTDCPLCRATVPTDADDPANLTLSLATGDRVIDHVVKALPPLVQQQRRAAKRLRERDEEHDASIKRRKLDVEFRTRIQHQCVEAVISLALVAVLGSLTWLF